ncbi:MAG: hypothetical protein NUV57_05460 [archaeon]|nr:hypothetical protein [archaeon]
MNTAQSVGIAIVIAGLVFLLVFPIFGIFGEIFFEISFFAGWGLSVLGAGIILISLIQERRNDIKKEKFDKY